LKELFRTLFKYPEHSYLSLKFGLNFSNGISMFDKVGIFMKIYSFHLNLKFYQNHPKFNEIFHLTTLKEEYKTKLIWEYLEVLEIIDFLIDSEQKDFLFYIFKIKLPNIPIFFKNWITSEKNHILSEKKQKIIEELLENIPEKLDETKEFEIQYQKQKKLFFLNNLINKLKSFHSLWTQKNQSAIKKIIESLIVLESQEDILQDIPKRKKSSRKKTQKPQKKKVKIFLMKISLLIF
jgi:hypothetical protein